MTLKQLTKLETLSAKDRIVTMKKKILRNFALTTLTNGS